MGRKSLLKATGKKPAKVEKGDARGEVERKKAILDGVPHFPGSIKSTLKDLGLAQSTYYTWSKRFKADGMEGLKAGNPLSDKVWKRFVELEGKQEEPVKVESKIKAKETQTMKSEQDREKTNQLLFKRFDEGPSKPLPKEAVQGKKRAPEPVKSKVEKKQPSPPAYTPPPQEPMDKTLKYALGAFAFVVAIIMVASVSNSNKFYFKQNEQMIELWRGRFAPMGEVIVGSFSDPKIIEGLPQQARYTKSQTFDVLSKYFVGRADEILRSEETPDLKAAKSYLRHASKYAVTEANRKEVRRRVRSINQEVARIRQSLDTFAGEQAGKLGPKESTHK